MVFKSLSMAVAILALAAFISQSAVAEEKAAGKPHEGKVVKASDGKLTMTDKDGIKEHTHTVPADAKITCDGKECKLEDLKPGYHVKVTTKENDKTTATKIEATKERKQDR